MRRLGVMTVFMFLFCSAFADVKPHLVEKADLDETNAYFFDSNGVFWRVISCIPRTRGPIEWWNNVQLVPDNYKTALKNWQVGVPITAYLKYGNLPFDESNASNQSELKACSHLIVNEGNGEVLFAIPLEPASCLLSISRDFQSKGYRNGKQAGQNDGYQSGFKWGEVSGYQRGYSEGLTVKQQQIGVDRFEAGKKEGYSEGYEAGKREGNSPSKASYQQAYNEGYAAGKREGNSSNNTSYEEGYKKGLSDQYKIDKQTETQKCSDAYEEGYKDGLADQQRISKLGGK